MATTRLTNSGFKVGITKYDSFLTGYPQKMATPTAADGGTGTSATVSFTAVPGATGYRAISSPGSFTGTGTTSPITVSGLTADTAYTFQIQAQNNVGYGAYSAASNSVSPVSPYVYQQIATVTVGSGGASSISFSSIPSTYKHLQLRMVYTSATVDNLTMTLNGSTTSSRWHYLLGDASSAAAGSQTINYLSAQAGVAANIFYGGILDILDYTNTNKNKVVRMLNGADTGSPAGVITLSSNIFETTSAISSISIAMRNSNSISQYSQFALYGVKG